MLARNVQLVEQDLQLGFDFVKKIAANSLGVYAVSMLPDFVNNSDNLIQRNAMRGFAWYLADEVGEELLTQNSNFRNFGDMNNMDRVWTGIYNAIDDSVFYGLASLTVEQTQLDVPVSNFVNGFIESDTISQNLSLGFLLTVSKWTAQELEKMGWHMLTNITSHFTHKTGQQTVRIRSPPKL